jgi:rRNA maturation RNase YbeY
MMESAEQDDPGGDRALRVDDQQQVVVDRARVRDGAARALESLGVPARIAELKREALGIREHTDVLAFGVDDPFDPAPGPTVLGDIVICPAIATRQARALGRSLEREIDELTVHAILHLVGRDHDRASSERAMAREQRRILDQIGARR